MIRLFGGKEAEQKMTILMGVEQPWLQAAFTAIDEQWGDFETYVTQGLKLSEQDINSLRTTLLN